MNGTLTVGITTSPRTTRYLLPTIRSLRAAAATVAVRIIVAPNFRDPGEDWDAVRAEVAGAGGEVLAPLVGRELRDHVEAEDTMRDYRVGNNIYASEWVHRGIQRNSDRLYQYLVDLQVPFFLTIQDDVAFCRRAADRIYQLAMTVLPRHHIPPVGAISFYSPHDDCGRARRALWRYSGSMFYGELAVLWLRRCAIDFLKASNQSNAHDLEIGRFFEARAGTWRLYGHSPCLAQHVGVDSARGDVPMTGAITNGHRRQTQNFNAAHDAVKEAKPWS